MPFSVRTLNAAFIQVHQELEQAAYVSGASWLTTFLRVTLTACVTRPRLRGALDRHSRDAFAHVPMFLTTQGNEVLAMLTVDVLG